MDLIFVIQLLGIVVALIGHACSVLRLQLDRP